MGVKGFLKLPGIYNFKEALFLKGRNTLQSEEAVQWGCDGAEDTVTLCRQSLGGLLENL